jgi:hypothetical protein
MTPEQKLTLRFAHSALIDFMQFLIMWNGNKLNEIRLITNIPEEIKDLQTTITELENEFPHLDPDLTNYN